MRPFIYKTAELFKLTGTVKNQGASVLINISGEKGNVGSFIRTLTACPPENARIDRISINPLETADYADFRILNSTQEDDHQVSLLPDIAVCDDCIEDIKDINNRRNQYAFTNCTNCGPRYSILKELPYDRINTSMDSFDMCELCIAEYNNPLDRRFHAQPNCCPACGPQYILVDSNGNRLDYVNIIYEVKRLLKSGSIIAVKGIGGYHLVCNAMDENAVSLLRRRKNRPHKPFAVMARDIEAVKQVCHINKTEEVTLLNNRRPIVILTKSINDILPESVAPQLNRYGVMLPYTPMHYLLLDDTLQYLVMTSGNISGMPLCYKDNDAFENLKSIADSFLFHNREILTPVDDSVVKVVNNEVAVSRCGRGYAPASLPIEANKGILALGGQQKACVCIIDKGIAQISQYLGELNNMDACNEYINIVKRLSLLLKAQIRYVAHDLHPDYFSTHYANILSQEKIAIQHHHAHMAGCMAEHSLTKDVIGVVFDGTGMGTDGAAWGGEFFVGNRAAVKRVGHLEYASIQGGELAIREPWRCTASYLHSLNMDFFPFFHNIDSIKKSAVEKALSQKINCFNSSSMGRLFDCVAALVLGITQITYDAQAAIVFESILDSAVTDRYTYTLSEREADGVFIIGYGDIIKGVLYDMSNCLLPSYISAKFHNSICEVTVDCVSKISKKNNIHDVVLSGGVFENTYLLTNIVNGLKKQSLNVYFNKKVPINDGGLSFGQAAAAAEIIKE